MEWRDLFSSVCKAVLLLFLTGVGLADAEQCRCSDIECITAANSTGECCLWDFPSDSLASTATEPTGFVYGRTTMNAPSLCITYPINTSRVDLNNYFLVKLDVLQGPDVCVSESGKPENKSCSVTLQTMPVKKAVYCTRDAVSGVQSVQISVNCTNCSIHTSSFLFKVYSMAFDSVQERWCDEVDTTVPSENHVLTNTPPRRPTPSHKPTVSEPSQHVDNDKDPSTDGNNNTAHGLTGSLLTSLALLIAATLVA